MQTFTPTPQPKLAWNANGRIACSDHQPFGSTWGLEGWEAITDEDQAMAEDEGLSALSCEDCR